MVYKWLINSLTHWWPQACFLCGQTSQHHALCPDCVRDLPRFSYGCQQCGLPIPDHEHLCGQCQQRPPAYDHVFAAFAYDTPVAELVSQLKFRQQLQLARLFGELLATGLGTNRDLPQALLPVPLHPNRLRSRGYNQALEIARPAGRILSMPVLNHVLHRIRDTAPQSEQAATNRHHNIRGAFSLQKPITCRHIAIVDDVMTSGHTVGEIAQVLRKAGVERIDVWCVARAWPRIRSGI